MKKLLFIFGLVLIASCGKKQIPQAVEVPIDSTIVADTIVDSLMIDTVSID